MSAKHKRFLAEAAKRRAKAVKRWNGGNGETMEVIAADMQVTRQRVSQWLKLEAIKADKGK